MSTLVIVESPTKAKTISKFLPKDFIVEASVGHIRDLPQTAKDVPAELKELKWTRLGINVEDDFHPLYIIPKSKQKVIKKLADHLKKVTQLFLATDEDREGESICWHLLEVLKPKVSVKRMVFHEITNQAIQSALKNARDVDMRLVRAQETRRLLDRLFGYTLSPLIWKKISFGLSAGRVQSPALRIIVEREFQRMRFKRHSYWDLLAEFIEPVAFQARLLRYKGNTVAQSRHFDSITGEYTGNDTVVHIDGDLAEKILQDLPEKWTITTQESKNTTQRPSPPYITASLQQDANRKLYMNARQCMRTAQSLYEAGYITYMRTDSPTLSQEALRAAREKISTQYGDAYLPESPRYYRSRSQTSQEAHEAIRPAGTSFKIPSETPLAGNELKLYTMIYNRTLASQMNDAKKKTLSIRIEAGDCIFGASATMVLFPGFLAALGVQPTEIPLIESLKEGEQVTPQQVSPDPHETKPPPRYSEASIVQILEEKGIGRPSTYANIISTLYERKYVTRKDSALVPTFTGLAVANLLQVHFPKLVTDEFTRIMEESLDHIASGTTNSLDYLKDFYLGDSGLKEWIAQVEPSIQAEQARQILVPAFEEAVKISRYGAYIELNGDADTKVNIPADIPPADVTKEIIKEISSTAQEPPATIGVHPENGKTIYYLIGPYGPYLQLGERGAKPKRQRVTVPKEEISLDDAVKLLSLPRKLGKHPEQKKDVFVTVGPYGPYVGCEKEYRPLEESDDVYEIDLDRALELLAQPKKRRRRRAASQST